MPRKQSLPPCRDFLIATVRTLRLNRPTMKPGTSAGVGSWRVRKVVSDKYSDEEIQVALNELIKDGTIVVIAQKHLVRMVGRTRYISPTSSLVIPKASAQMPAWRGHWRVSLKGRIIPRDHYEKHTEYDYYGGSTIYVVEDGLSPNIEKVIRGDKRTVADKVLATFPRSRKRKKK